MVCAALNVYFLPGSSWYHKDFYGPFTPGQREAYIGETAPIRNVIAWFNRTHPQAAVLLTQDSYIAGLDGDVYENHWHQYNTMDQIRRAPGVQASAALLDQWKVHYLIARKATASHYARPLALRELLDQCTIAEYVFDEFFVARLEPVCRAAAPLAVGARTDRQARHLRRFRSLDPLCSAIGSRTMRRSRSLRPHRHATPIPRAPRSAFAFEGERIDVRFHQGGQPRHRGQSPSMAPARGTIDLYSRRSRVAEFRPVYGSSAPAGTSW